MKRDMYGDGSRFRARSAYTGRRSPGSGTTTTASWPAPTDYGTYQDPAVEYPYLQAETTYVVDGRRDLRAQPAALGLPDRPQRAGDVPLQLPQPRLPTRLS